MRISLITACRNAVGSIGSTFESVRRQKVEGCDLEYIVVDGASTDGTVDVIRRFDDEVKGNGEKGNGAGGSFSFRWISEKDHNLYDGINKGIRMSTGDVIGICNADDVLADDDVLSKIAAAFDESGGSRRPAFGLRASGSSADAVYADIRFVRPAVADLDHLRKAPAVRYCRGRFFANWQFRFGTFPAHPSTFVRRECFEKYGLYSLDYPICADFELMLRFFCRHGIRTRYLPICTHIMRTGGLSTKGMRANMEINREDLRALRAHGVWSCLPLVYLKYLVKIWGVVFRG